MSYSRVGHIGLDEAPSCRQASTSLRICRIVDNPPFVVRAGVGLNTVNHQLGLCSEAENLAKPLLESWELENSKLKLLFARRSLI
jgi:hypothetical protein